MEREVEKIVKLIKQSGKGRFCVAVDGWCGSGKTTFCNMLAQQLDANVIHIDNFYLPFEERVENWRQVTGGNMDFAKFENKVLIPFKNGEGFDFDSFNHRGPVKFTHYNYEARDILIIDGSYSHFPHLCRYYDMKIYLKCRAEKQAERLMKREKDNFAIFRDLWIPKEQKYNRELNIEKGADIVIDTSDLF